MTGVPRIAEVIARRAALDDLNGADAADAHGRVALFAFPLLGFDWLQALGLVLAAQDAVPPLCQISKYSSSNTAGALGSRHASNIASRLRRQCLEASRSH
jgi:hypothetical protein